MGKIRIKNEYLMMMSAVQYVVRYCNALILWTGISLNIRQASCVSQHFVRQKKKEYHDYKSTILHEVSMYVYISVLCVFCLYKVQIIEIKNNRLNRT